MMLTRAPSRLGRGAFLKFESDVFHTAVECFWRACGNVLNTKVVSEPIWNRRVIAEAKQASLIQGRTPENGRQLPCWLALGVWRSWYKSHYFPTIDLFVDDVNCSSID